MEKYSDRNEPKPYGSKGYDMIVSTYNSHKFPVIENQTNAFVFPWNMQRDVDSIDSMRFSEVTTETSEGIGVDNIPASPKNIETHKKLK
ncbi:MAG: hypothetical protein FH751_07750 [Firmicutes bacterium]|nr:hypothetical protein [Bacillota bacterium]